MMLFQSFCEEYGAHICGVRFMYRKFGFICAHFGLKRKNWVGCLSPKDFFKSRLLIVSSSLFFVNSIFSSFFSVPGLSSFAGDSCAASGSFLCSSCGGVSSIRSYVGVVGRDTVWGAGSGRVD